jgi:predicted lipoprotein with Yx(FWY)xxD motif
MNRFRYVAASLLALAATAAASSLPQRNAQGLLVGHDGRTLYRYDPDGSSGHSRCAGSCASVWPPYVADAKATANGGFELATRSDGSRQWVYRGSPLYLFAGDEKPGDRQGDGVNGSWHVVR